MCVFQPSGRWGKNNKGMVWVWLVSTVQFALWCWALLSSGLWPGLSLLFQCHWKSSFWRQTNTSRAETGWSLHWLPPSRARWWLSSLVDSTVEHLEHLAFHNRVLVPLFKKQSRSGIAIKPSRNHGNKEAEATPFHPFYHPVQVGKARKTAIEVAAIRVLHQLFSCLQSFGHLLNMLQKGGRSLITGEELITVEQTSLTMPSLVEKEPPLTLLAETAYTFDHKLPRWYVLGKCMHF